MGVLENRVVDKLLLLYVINHANARDLGITKLQKLVFLIEETLHKNKMCGFSYEFIRYHYGPFSITLAKDFSELVENDLVFEAPRLQLTPRSKEILERSKNLFDENSHIIKRINAVVGGYAGQSLNKIKSLIYDKVQIDNKKLRDIPEGVTVLSKLTGGQIFEIDKEWVETLDILFDKIFSDSLRRAIKTPAKILLK